MAIGIHHFEIVGYPTTTIWAYYDEPLWCDEVSRTGSGVTYCTRRV